MSVTEFMPNVEVPGISPVPYPFGLFSIAPVATPGGNWQSGIWWQSAACQQVGTTFAPCNVADPVPDLAANVVCGVAMAPTFTVYAKSDMSVGGSPLAEKFGRARDLLLAGEQHAVEAMLWQVMLAATPAPDVTAATVVEAVGLAEALIANRYGGTPVLHLGRYPAVLAGAGGGVFRSAGARMSTMLGTSVVAGGGYPPDGATPKPALSVIATGAVVIVRSEMFDVGQHIDMQSNNISAVVERTYAVGWDCAAVRVAVPAG